MKLTAAIFVVICLLSGLQGEAQTVSLSVKNAKLEFVLKGFKKQTGYSFFYNEALLAKAGRVTLDLTNVPLAEALSLMFSKQPALDYSIVGKTVTVNEKIIPQNQASQTAGQSPPVVLFLSGKSVTGVVVNKRFESLVNASVMVKGKKKGTSTGVDGSFKLDELKEDDVLVASYIGYKTAEITVKDQEKINFVLEESTNQLDEVVAKGYSKTTQRFSTASVNKVSGEEVGSRQVMNPLLALQGRVPGVVVTPMTGYNSGPINIEIRGRGLLGNAGGTPLIVIDGNPLPVLGGGALGDLLGGTRANGPVQGIISFMGSPVASQSPLFGLNPKDIESIEILKDVGATAIYGSLGANGVILITTKKAKAGSSLVDVNVNYGITKITRYWKMLNTPQYLEMRREAFRNDGIIPTPQNAPDLLLWDTTAYTDWQKYFWGNTGKVMNATVGISGGNNQLTHRITANYSESQSISSFSGKDKTAGVRLSLGHKSNDQKFSALIDASYTYAFSDMISMSSVSRLPPNAPPLFTESGLLNYKAWNDVGQTNYLGPFERMKQPVESNVNTLAANLRTSYQFNSALSFVTMIGYTSYQTNATQFSPSTSFNPLYNPKGQATFNLSSTASWNIEPQINYEVSVLGKGRFTAVIGASLKQYVSRYTSIIASGYANDAMLKSMNLAPNKDTYNGETPYKYTGVFGVFSYRWDNKYMLDMNVRRDGSSKFGPGNRFGNFGSVGLGWIASEEPWLKKIISPVVSFLKFYGNTGTAGDDGGKDYQYISQWGSNFGMLNYDDKLSLLNMHAVNQDYHWQLMRELNLGMNMTLFSRNKLTVNVEYYRKRISDQLTSNPTPFYTGFENVYGNWPATVQNSGWAASVSLNIINKQHFGWDASANAAFNKNIFSSFPGIEYSNYYFTSLIGRSLGSNYLLNYLGVDPMTGDYQYQDYNHDGRIEWTDYMGAPLDGSNDRMLVIDQNPWITGGMSHNFRYRNFRLNMSFDFAGQKGMNAIGGIGTIGAMGNIPVEIFENRWQKPGDITRYSKFSSQYRSFDGTSISNLGYTDASFLRLKFVSLSYSLPESWKKRLGMSDASFSVDASNLYSFTRYKGIDPEMRNFGGMPQGKIITAGFNLTF